MFSPTNEYLKDVFGLDDTAHNNNVMIVDLTNDSILTCEKDSPNSSVVIVDLTNDRITPVTEITNNNNTMGAQNLTDILQDNALHYAVRDKNVALINLLVSKPWARDNLLHQKSGQDQTPLELAAKLGNDAIFLLLLKAEFDYMLAYGFKQTNATSPSTIRQAQYQTGFPAPRLDAKSARSYVSHELSALTRKVTGTENPFRLHTNREAYQNPLGVKKYAFK
ncbi:MAG: ankyrin repeat domain-containing protein [Gammaproteobacteria bacterium]